MQKNIAIVHYNTPELTECLVKSINKLMDDVHIYILDNSDEQPFTAKYDNITIFDNTSGQIIDFQSWLENYQNKTKSNGRVNNFASAKHAYSVEKCMELIGENFLLMDSDILLKQDITPLFRNDAIYVGETVTQPNSVIKRVLPYLCFINVEMCQKNNAHYFNDDYMHGLRKSLKADMYDTGAGFYMETLKQPHVDIVIDDYAIHYGHGSWNKPGDKKALTQKQWLALNRQLWSDKEYEPIPNTKVVYTCITGDYDTLNDPEYVTEGWDYICFTDNETLTSDIWDIRPMPEETSGLSQVKKQRYVKINPHKTLSDYEISVWVDGNVRILGNMDEFIIKQLTQDVSVYVPKHPSRNCIYMESKVVIAMRKDTKENVNPQIERYKQEGFPKDYGLLQSNILLRKHNDKDCIRLMECWFDELKEHSHRDQLSFNYVLWKNNDVKVTYMDKQICNSKYFKWMSSHRRRQNPIVKTARVIKTSAKREKQPTQNYLEKRKFDKLAKTRLYW